MTASAIIKRLEILHPALESIDGDSGHGESSTSDDNCLGVRILYCTGTTAIDIITKQFINQLPLYTYDV